MCTGSDMQDYRPTPCSGDARMSERAGSQHRAWARIDLAAIRHNCEVIIGRLNQGTRLGAVVKANAYGHGTVPTAKAAIEAGASDLFVATADEAIELREGGITTPIVVLGALSANELKAATQVRAHVVAWREKWVACLPPGTHVHVKLDTGMRRLGASDATEAIRVVEEVMSRPDLTLAGVMTHFSTASDDQDFVGVQLDQFETWVTQVKREAPNVTAHCANSAATLTSSATHFDLVRCGLALYGLDPFGLNPAHHGLVPALQLGSWVASLRPVEAGEGVGYARSWVAPRSTWIATLPIGYGDGVRWAFSNNLEVVIGGRSYPVRGSVSMDNLAVEVGPRPQVQTGDDAVIIGPTQSAEDLARRIGTINYEIVCGISQRTFRTYHGGEQPTHVEMQ